MFLVLDQFIVQEQLLKLPKFIQIGYLLVTKAFKMITISSN